MTVFHKHWTTKCTAIFLAVVMLWGGQVMFPRETRLDRLFQWAIKNYLDGKYWEVTKDLELLLSYCDEGNNELKGKIYLLQGAVYEQLGDVGAAKRHYRLSHELLKNPSISELDITNLKEYQRIIMKNKKIIAQKIIEKPALKKRKKKRISVFYIALGGALLAGLVMAFVMKKKVKPKVIDVVPDYDTRMLGIEWMRVPEGEFLMGDNFNEGESDEQPVHSVYLSEYFISKYEVTFEQYDYYCDLEGAPRPSDNNWGRGDRPVINVTREVAEGFCQWLSQKTGKKIHLPTEAQWEKAARGTDQRRFPWGNSPEDCTRTNHNFCSNQTQPVGSHPEGVSPYGVHDMAGNVAELCQDAYNQYYYSNSPYNNPLFIPETDYWGTHYVVRGGIWGGTYMVSIRSADRGSISKGTSNIALGFRLVMER